MNLILCIRKSFWSSKYCITLGKIISIESKSLQSVLKLICLGLWYTIFYNPKTIVLTNEIWSKRFFLILRYIGFFRKKKFVLINLNAVPYFLAAKAHKIVYYSSSEVQARAIKMAKYGAPSNQGEFFFIPVDGDFASVSHRPAKNYLYCGGGNRRDFKSAIALAKALNKELFIRTFQRNVIPYDGYSKLCINANFVESAQFLQEMADSEAVILPLVPTSRPHGHTTLAQALTLGKLVFVSANASCDDYIEHGINGFLIQDFNDPREIKFIASILQNSDIVKKVETNALSGSVEFSYEKFANRMHRLLETI